ncbi:MAG: hypothetical protein ACPK7O_08785 [Methanobacterium sp.]
MANMNDWIIECKNCGRNYDIPESIPSNFDIVNNREQLILKASPKCPFCHSINSSIPRWK